MTDSSGIILVTNEPIRVHHPIHEASYADSMTLSDRSRFVLFESLLIILGFAIAAQVSPPDVYTQIIRTVVVLAVTLPLSYWFVYRP